MCDVSVYSSAASNSVSSVTNHQKRLTLFAVAQAGLVHVVGGVTYEEIKAVHDVNAELGANVTIGSNEKIWRSEEFMEHLRNYKVKGGGDTINL